MKLDKVKYLKRVIAISWLALLACFIIKIFGGNFFVILCDNERFISVCEYADTHFWASYLIGVLHTTFSLYFLHLAICERRSYKRWELITLISTVCIVTAIKLINPNIGVFFDLWQLIVMPMIFEGRGKRRCIFAVLGNILLVAFQLLSMLTKSVGVGFVTQEGLVISLIYSIDVDFMIVLYYLYTNYARERRTEL